jgi:uncharacterized protein (TIGR02058 family)
MSKEALVYEFGMGLDLHGGDATKAACRAAFDAIHHSSLPLARQIRDRGGKMLVDVTVGVPDPGSVDLEPVPGGLKVPGGDGIIACLSLTVSAEYPA